MLLLSLVACEPEAPPTPPPSRVNAVVAAPKKAVTTAEFCTDAHASAAEAKSFALPTIDGAPMARSEGWRWVNLWATWCKPCVAEMPMLGRWQAKLGEAGVKFSLEFLSVDAKAQDVTDWRKVHTSAPPSMRIAKFEDLGAWLPTVGLDSSAVIPIHFFVDPDDKIRCVRMGAIEESDFDTVKAVFSGA